MTVRLLIPLFCAGACVAQEVRVWTDAPGDAVLRRTDLGNDAAIGPNAVLPDLAEVRLCGWSPSNGMADPYSGDATAGGQASVMRLDVVFHGLVNPAGPLGLDFEPYDPFRYGPSPVVGYLEIDIDADVNTGGHPFSQDFHYLGNVARFGGVAQGPLAERTARNDIHDRDTSCVTGPLYERSGDDFTLLLCSCFDPSVVDEGGVPDGVFNAGDTWILRSRYLELSEGYADVYCGYYDPEVDIRFSHDIATNKTTITAVFPLDSVGVTILTGVQNPLDCGDGDVETECLVEALSGVTSPNCPVLGCPLDMTRDWLGDDPLMFLDPTQWEVHAIFGTPYAGEEPTIWAWSDVGFDTVQGDLDGDGDADADDRSLIEAAIAAMDGTGDDADGVINNSVEIVFFALNFDVHDVNGDGFIDSDDLEFYPGCVSDWDRSGDVGVSDLLQYLEVWFPDDPLADVNEDLDVDVLDLLSFLTGFYTGC